MGFLLYLIHPSISNGAETDMLKQVCGTTHGSGCALTVCALRRITRLREVDEGPWEDD